MQSYLFTSMASAKSSRVLYTPSAFARSSLLHLQEAGTLQALHPHTSTRNNLTSFLFFIVLSGMGEVEYEGKKYELETGHCVFIDCQKAYSHSTGYHLSKDDNTALWSLQWCHFYGPLLSDIYEKYRERGGQPVFRIDDSIRFTSILDKLYVLASSPDYIRDMRINETLSSLLTLIMEQSWHPESRKVSRKRLELEEVKKYLDEHYIEEIALDELAERHYINKYYLTKIFKETYGSTVISYVLVKRITRAKQLLRFTDMTIDEIGNAVGMKDANYFSRMFRKVEGISPREYRKRW